ncbi:hypothetical protein PO883_10580 [Massilia sp. DJPM01]|uniref:hypothetical protein n=1 Tax=Massilia sp. DJPM01 TaxID=3024404 RepID=UPI00259E1449|nr:hypothetical protein [Massilia sp. DJPM01]MDM5177635.1 hypothetical protein [Massilia sp. DJPM01]
MLWALPLGAASAALACANTQPGKDALLMGTAVAAFAGVWRFALRVNGSALQVLAVA